jgi:hypothetical protein
MIRHLLIAIAVLGASACEQAPQDDDEARRAVTELVQRWSDAGESQQWDAVADTYADVEGFAWIEQGETRYASRAAIIEGLDQARSMSAAIRNDVSDIVVTPLGADAAAFRARYLLNVSAEGFNYESQGVLSGVAIKQDGVWRFLQGSFSEQPPSRDGD